MSMVVPRLILCSEQMRHSSVSKNEQSVITMSASAASKKCDQVPVRSNLVLHSD